MSSLPRVRRWLCMYILSIFRIFGRYAQALLCLLLAGGMQRDAAIFYIYMFGPQCNIAKGV
jgi:hypothetical protein